MSVIRLSGRSTPIGAYTTPGAMTHQVSIYQPGTRNSNGTYAADQLVTTSWAGFRNLGGRELDRAREVVQNVSVIITMSYIDTLQQHMTIVCDGDTYQIEYIVDPDLRHVEQRCYCSLVNQTE